MGKICIKIEKLKTWVSELLFIVLTIIVGIIIGSYLSPSWNIDEVQTIIMIGAFLVSTFSAFVAYNSLTLSIKAQKSISFSNLFNTQLSLLTGYFNSNNVMRTEMVHNCTEIGNLKLVTNNTIIADVSKDAPLYKSFCQYFLDNTNHISGSELNGRQICNIWHEFCKHIKYQSEFEYSFKFIYLCISSIQKSQISDEDKHKYMKVVTDLINSEQLFCYFVNLIANCDGDCSDDPTVRTLRENYFFEDLFNSTIYKQVKNKLPNTIVKCFSKHN